jgi:hypothetical protein
MRPVAFGADSFQSDWYATRPAVLATVPPTLILLRKGGGD